ncbi:MAG: dihydroorotase [Bacteroidetes bacterium]|nr:dihydroorotase [Bacteroidota bacterium]
MAVTLIQNATVVNEGKIFPADVVINNETISAITAPKSAHVERLSSTVLDATGLYMLPGVIDCQVHFREPGLTHKGDIYTESRAAVAGGITSFMEMPNTVPPVLTQDLLEEKYAIASEKSLANFSFYMGFSDDNLDEVLRTDPATVCGVKAFLGSTTGEMLIRNPRALEELFSKCRLPVAVHCEDDDIIRKNSEEYRKKFGADVPVEYHPAIRSAEACYKSSSFAVDLARKYNTRLHVIHVSTAKETSLFDNDIPLSKKHITAEVCVHHLWFSNEDYKSKGSLIKWNPAIKTKEDREGLFLALLDNRLDIIATDHAPHTLEEKEHPYFQCPSGAPMVQHSLAVMLEFYHREKITVEKIVEKMCHTPAICFGIEKRGFIRKGYYADFILVDLNAPWTVDKTNIHYKCGWSPLEGETFRSTVTHTFVNGYPVYENGRFNETKQGKRIIFRRQTRS